MGSIVFVPQVLADTLSETAGYKSGLTLSIEQLCDTLEGTGYSDTLRNSEKSAVRLRSEEYEELFYKLLHRIGFTEEEYGGFAFESARLFHKYKHTALKEFEGVSKLFTLIWPRLMKNPKATGIDPRPLLDEAYRRFGALGLEIAIERIEILDRSLRLYPHSGARYSQWTSTLALDGLFQGSDAPAEDGAFIDQRYINYLFRNPDKLGSMHWRKFEELTSEFFRREGFSVEIGPGSNDDGVDIRIWKPDEVNSQPPLCLIQCKRTKAKVEKVVVKGLYADVVHHDAKHGLIVTTSELSPGARSTITTRGYPIGEVNKEGLKQWLLRLREVGTGIVRI
jgi:restriction system protein